MKTYLQESSKYNKSNQKLPIPITTNNNIHLNFLNVPNANNTLFHYERSPGNISVMSPNFRQKPNTNVKSLSSPSDPSTKIIPGNLSYPSPSVNYSGSGSTPTDNNNGKAEVKSDEQICNKKNEANCKVNIATNVLGNQQTKGREARSWFVEDNAVKEFGGNDGFFNFERKNKPK